MNQLTDDRLMFTFPEIARQLRAHVERQVGHILPEFLRPEERTALLAELESRWGFQQLDGEAQDRQRLRVLTLTADEIEAALRAAALRGPSPVSAGRESTRACACNRGRREPEPRPRQRRSKMANGKCFESARCEP